MGGLHSLAAGMAASEAPGSFLSISFCSWISPDWHLSRQLRWSRPETRQGQVMSPVTGPPRTQGHYAPPTSSAAPCMVP